MNTKIFSKTIVAAAGIFCLAGCDGFLDTTPTDKISDKIVWESEETVQLYINSFYAYIDHYGIFALQIGRAHV